MPKVSFTTLLAVVLLAGLAFLAFNPEVGREVVDWVRTQFRGEMPKVGSPNYMPVVPGL